MSINWVMLHETQAFVRLPGEKPVWKSSSKTSLAITTPRTYPAHSPLSIHSSSGTIYLTNQRVVYLPASPTHEFRSFSVPLLNLHDSHVTLPWFGPNVWQAVLQPVPGGNIPTGHSSIELKFTFKEGGATDFHTNFERIKERFQQALEAAQGEGLTRPQAGSAYAGVNVDAVHLDQLPTYEASGMDRVAPVPETTTRVAAQGINSELCFLEPEPTPPLPSVLAQQTSVAPPTDAPPGYEETQQQSVQEELERRLTS